MISGEQVVDFNFRRFVEYEVPGARYPMINREERHYGAVLFHLLARPDNVKRLLKYANFPWKFNPQDYEVYFEYSYMRDLWHAMEKTGSLRKREAILQLLKQSGGRDEFLERLRNINDQQFNEFFLIPVNGNGNGQNRNLSKYIQSPANWRLSAFSSKQLEDHNMIAVCKVKWSFRIKPDLVIHTDDNHALCIELKLEAGEGFYPSDGTEKKLLVFRISQTELQKFMMEKLLGLECRFLLITRHPDKAPTELSWRGLCDELDHSDLPNYLERALKRTWEPAQS